MYIYTHWNTYGFDSMLILAAERGLSFFMICLACREEHSRGKVSE
jgi:hypothetical protein